ncbi:putative C6 and C2H2 transcription factor -like protein [Rosellinia necatrix]|uniref:Putative C6 and C2H2 transcription factor-like protein n=1 Tax=Rosellinia necatrix TaxID=77044 RepID=A0A1S7UJS5_ROSNE|nr:putative C6 and C2H2 transcription factor -like protein [Rosellinia necatrix]
MADDHTSLGRDEEAWEPSNAIPTQFGTQEKYQCPQCASSFKRPENLKRHQRGHDERRRFACPICGKSFARSDILSRHTAIHVPQEQRNDNPHRRRACRECARVRERCSRGEPCRRCAMKSLGCVYPEEPGFKITTPHNWCSSTSEAGDYYTAEAGGFDPRYPPEAAHAGIDAASHGSGHWGTESLPPAYEESYIQSPSTLPQGGYHSYQPSPHETPITSYYRYEAPPLPEKGPYPGSTDDISMDDTGFTTSGAEFEAFKAEYEGETTAMPLIHPSQMGAYQSGQSTEFQHSYAYEQGFDSRHFSASLATQGVHSSDLNTHAALLDQRSDTMYYSGASGTYMDPVGASASNMGYGGDETTPFQPPQPQCGNIVDLKAYEQYVATALEEPHHNNNNPYLPFE